MDPFAYVAELPLPYSMYISVESAVDSLDKFISALAGRTHAGGFTCEG